MKKIINILFNDFTNDNRVLKESVSLVEEGYEVELVATRFERDLPKEENIKGIHVVRVGVGHLVFLPINLFLFWLNVIRKYKRESLFHCNDLYALPPAFVIKKLFNKDAKIVYDCHEHETEAGIYVGKPILKAFAKFFEKFMIHSTDSVITVSESIAGDYVSIYGIEKPQLVLNCPRYMEYSNEDLFRKEFGIGQDKILFLYQGEYLKGRGVDKLIDVFKDLESKNKDLVLVLLVYGEGIGVLKEKIQGCSNIYWHDKVSPDIYMNYVASADWGVHFMENTCKNHDYAMPNKLFDYFMGGLPVIVSNLKEMSNFVKKHDVGYVIDLEKPDKAVDIIKNIHRNSKEKFLKNVEKVAKEYTWEQQEKVLLKVYNSQ